MTDGQSFFIVGGAGFIGSHFCDRLLGERGASKVTVFDNLVSGRSWHVDQHSDDPRFRLVQGDIEDLAGLTRSMEGHDVVIHLASNPDIARAVTEPAIDFTAGTLLTHHVVEAMREAGPRRMIYASGSGVYGELGDLEVDESYGPLIPISTYAASKIAGEALISSYCGMFGFQASVFRFGNVVGPRQTHGVGYDFLRRLREDGSQLVVLGDGYQSKSYIHVEDVVEAVLLAFDRADEPFTVYNVATGDYTTVREIADDAIDAIGLDRSSVDVRYGDADRGWLGDVPVVRLNTDRIQKLGWSRRRSSREALRASLQAMAADPRHWGG